MAKKVSQLLPDKWMELPNGHVLSTLRIAGHPVVLKIPDNRVSKGHLVLAFTTEETLDPKHERQLLTRAWQIGETLVGQQQSFDSFTVIMHNATGRKSGYAAPHAHIFLTEGREGVGATYLALAAHSLPALLPKQLLRPLVDAAKRLVVIYDG